MRNRREILETALWIGIGFILPSGLNAAAEKRPPSGVRCSWTEKQVNGFLGRLCEQDKFNAWEPRKEQIVNFYYAVETIHPDCHEEMSFVVWSYLHTYPIFSFINEYRRNRDKEATQFPKHQLLDMKLQGRPDSYGMILYREQMQTLCGELMGRKTLTQREYLLLDRRLAHNRFEYKYFDTLLSDKYRKSLAAEEKKLLLDAICFYWPHLQLYIYCSPLAGQAWQAALEEEGK